MKNERVKLIIKNMELLLQQLKLEMDEPQSNTIHINELITQDDYDEPDYYEESENDLPSVSLKWRD